VAITLPPLPLTKGLEPDCPHPPWVNTLLTDYATAAVLADRQQRGSEPAQVSPLDDARKRVADAGVPSFADLVQTMGDYDGPEVSGRVPTPKPAQVAAPTHWINFRGIDDTDEMMRVRAVLEAAGIKVPDGRLLAQIVQVAAPTQADGWQPMKTAPKDGAAVMALLEASDIPHAVKWCESDHFLAEGRGAGWYMTWDSTKIQPHDGPCYWMPILAAPKREGGE